MYTPKMATNYTWQRQLPAAKLRVPLPIAGGKSKPAKNGKIGNEIPIKLSKINAFYDHKIRTKVVHSSDEINLVQNCFFR